MQKLVRAVIYIFSPLLFLTMLFTIEWHKLKPKEEIPENNRKELIQPTGKALEYGDVSIGSVVTNNDSILGYGFNTVQRVPLTNDHTVIYALLDRSRRIFFSTHLPCDMYLGILQQYNIHNVRYLNGQSFFGS